MATGREVAGVFSGMHGVVRSDQRIDEGVIQWFGHVERMGNDRIAKIIYVRESAGIRPVGRRRERWTEAVKVCLKKRGSEVRQTRKMVNVRSVWGNV